MAGIGQRSIGNGEIRVPVVEWLLSLNGLELVGLITLVVLGVAATLVATGNLTIFASRDDDEF